jgi:tetratricopeptide (TPR) repeat protein
VTVVDREELEAERDFLLQSLDDLDSELAAGNIDPASYRELHDDYTARAAAVIKKLNADDDDSDDDDDVAVPPARSMKWVTIGALVVFVALASFLLAHAVGQRQPGGTPTGNDQVQSQQQSSADQASELAAAKSNAEANPRSYDARIRYARDLLGAGQYPTAIEEYVAASNIDPKQPEALAYSGWISALVAREVSDQNAKLTLLNNATVRLNQAIAVDPNYAPAYVFTGLLLSQIENKPCDAVPVFQRYLALAPQTDPMRNQVLDALSSAISAGKCPTTNTVQP